MVERRIRPQQLAVGYGVARQTVHKALQDAGLRPPPRPRKSNVPTAKIPADDTVFLIELARYATKAAAARAWGCSQAAVGQRLIRTQRRLKCGPRRDT